jgi:hypothetical protein
MAIDNTGPPTQVPDHDVILSLSLQQGEAALRGDTPGNQNHLIRECSGNIPLIAAGTPL